MMVEPVTASGHDGAVVVIKPAEKLEVIAVEDYLYCIGVK